jgi:hypothetical protein
MKVTFYLTEFQDPTIVIASVALTSEVRMAAMPVVSNGMMIPYDYLFLRKRQTECIA